MKRVSIYKYLVEPTRNLALPILVVIFYGCGNSSLPKEQKVSTREEIDQKAGVLISSYVEKALDDSGRVNGTFRLYQPEIVQELYEKRGFTTQWSDRDSLFPAADSLYRYLKNCRLYGLFPENYHLADLDSLTGRRKGADSLDAVVWGQTDILLTDAFVQMVHDVKLGRLPTDSLVDRTDSVLPNSEVLDQFDFLLRGKAISTILAKFEPAHPGYHAIKAGIPAFLARADLEKDITRIPFPVTDSNDYKSKLFKRLQEEKIIPDTISFTGVSQLVAGIKAFQKKNGLTDDGRMGVQTARRFNTSDKDRFFQIAITLDRYKLLPDTMPVRYVWVNIPAYQLTLVEKEEPLFQSKVVVGKPITRTPELTSSISQMITYPQWTIPASIIEKEILPALKRNPGYLAKKGYSLITSSGEEVDPFTVNWSKYKKGIPYKVVQGSGDDNALGILKFNFNNKYSVYLHDTNQRYFFSQAERALSHGCVRVQSWRQLADFILQNDSLQALEKRNKNYLPTDSLNTWLGNKEKRTIAIRNRIPLFIRYFTCEGGEKGIIFYDDIYQEDALLKNHYISVNN